MTPPASHLIGGWASDPADQVSICEYGQVTLEFSADGQLTYTVHSEGKRQIILLAYRVEGDMLVTDQPSSPREERTRFLLENGKLVLFYSDRQSAYIRNLG